MQLQHAIRTYLVCVCAEGRTAIVAREYRYILHMFLNMIGDMDVRALSPDHVRRYMADTPINEPQELRRHAAALRFFCGWLKVQDQVHPAVFTPRSLPKKAGHQSQRLAVRWKLPLAL